MSASVLPAEVPDCGDVVCAGEGSVSSAQWLAILAQCVGLLVTQYNLRWRTVVSALGG